MAAVIMVVVVAMAALTVDVGYMLAVEADMQGTADAAALAAMDELLSQRSGGTGEQEARTAARNEAEALVEANTSKVSWHIAFGIRDENGDFVEKDTSTPAWAARVKVGRDSDAPAGRLALFFAPVLGLAETDVRCTAVAQLSGQVIKVLENLAPFALYEPDMGKIGDTLTFTDVNSLTEGCFGLVDFTDGSASTSVLKDWILNGYDQEFGFDPSAGYVMVDACSGFRAALESAIQQTAGQERIVCVYDSLYGTGTGTDFRVVAFALVTIVDCDLDDEDGDGQTFITVRVEDMNEVDNVILGGGLSSSNIRRIQLAI